MINLTAQMISMVGLYSIRAHADRATALWQISRDVLRELCSMDGSKLTAAVTRATCPGLFHLVQGRNDRWWVDLIERSRKYQMPATFNPVQLYCRAMERAGSLGQDQGVDANQALSPSQLTLLALTSAVELARRDCHRAAYVWGLSFSVARILSSLSVQQVTQVACLLSDDSEHLQAGWGLLRLVHHSDLQYWRLLADRIQADDTQIVDVLLLGAASYVDDTRRGVIDLVDPSVGLALRSVASSRRAKPPHVKGSPLTEIERGDAAKLLLERSCRPTTTEAMTGSYPTLVTRLHAELSAAPRPRGPRKSRTDYYFSNSQRTLDASIATRALQIGYESVPFSTSSQALTFSLVAAYDLYSDFVHYLLAIEEPLSIDEFLRLGNYIHSGCFVAPAICSCGNTYLYDLESTGQGDSCPWCEELVKPCSCGQPVAQDLAVTGRTRRVCGKCKCRTKRSRRARTFTSLVASD